jgi:hypothetical protein
MLCRFVMMLAMAKGMLNSEVSRPLQGFSAGFADACCSSDNQKPTSCESRSKERLVLPSGCTPMVAIPISKQPGPPPAPHKADEWIAGQSGRPNRFPE